MKNCNKQLILLISLLIVFLSPVAGQVKVPPSLESSKNEPVVYTGQLNPNKQFFDGGLPHAVGVHHIQAFRANREHPSDPGETGFTYNHQPYLAYWNGKFYLQFLQAFFEEHHPPTRIELITSEDGVTWSEPVIAFPEYTLPEIHDDTRLIKAGTKSVMHQRMGFYVAPNGKLLISGFYSYCATPYNSPNAGDGLGRVIREIKKDGTMGPVFFIRYNRHAGWNEKNTNYPYYKESKDKDFLAACEALLADKLVSLQWWEEDRGKDGFYVIDPSMVPGGDSFNKNIVTASGAGKAFNFYHRPDGVVVGIWKNQYAALSPDNGKTWTDIAKDTTLWTTGAKTWGQKTEDGRFAIVHDQSATHRNRYPMVAIVGEDGHKFDRMYCLRSEVSPIRYQGIHKNLGPQYFRGIIEGNGNPPGSEMWNVYSMNKEDIWITSTRTPVTGSVENEVNDDFENAKSISDLNLWNLYVYKWAPVEIGKSNDNSYMVLKDEDPYDFAQAERIFPKAAIKEISFKFNIDQIALGYALEIEVQDQRGNRPLRLRIDKDWIALSFKKVKSKPYPISPNAWYNVTLNIDCNEQYYTLTLNGVEENIKIPFADKTDNVERIVFRTGSFRGYVPPGDEQFGSSAQAGLDNESLPGAGEKVKASVFFIDNLKTK